MDMVERGAWLRGAWLRGGMVEGGAWLRAEGAIHLEGFE